MIKSVLINEIYEMINKFDLKFVINHIFTTICKQLNLLKISLIICTDSYFLYQCLIQLEITSEKQFMIDIITLRQSYETREIDEIR